MVDMALYGRFKGFVGEIGESMHSGTTVSLMLERQDRMLLVALSVW